MNDVFARNSGTAWIIDPVGIDPRHLAGSCLLALA